MRYGWGMSENEKSPTENHAAVWSHAWSNGHHEPLRAVYCVTSGHLGAWVGERGGEAFVVNGLGLRAWRAQFTRPLVAGDVVRMDEEGGEVATVFSVVGPRVVLHGDPMAWCMDVRATVGRVIQPTTKEGA